MVRIQSCRPSLQTFILARTYELQNSPQKYAMSDGEDDAGGRAEDRLVGGLVPPAGGGGEGQDHGAHERREGKRPEAGPHHLAGARVPIDLGQHVAEHVAEREEQDARAKGEPAHLRHLGRADDVRAEQDGDEGRHHQVV
jgi:hypothetical protein